MLIKINNLNKSYYSDSKSITRALENINLDFSNSGLNFIVGESGSGKSTLLNIIGGIDNYDSGSVVVAGHSLSDLNSNELDYYRNSIIGFVFQEYNLLTEFSVRDNVKLALDINSIANEEKIDDILLKLGIKEIENNSVNDISSGQKQRVAIARALIKEPSILIADEPTGALDLKTSLEIIEIFKEISKEKLVIIITHDLDIASKYGDRIIELKDGSIIKDIEKRVSKKEKIETLSSNLIKVNQINDETVNKINEIKEEFDQKVYIVTSDNERKTKALFPNANFDSKKEGFITKNNINKEKMKQINLTKSKLKINRLLKLSLSNLLNKRVILILTFILMTLSLLLYGVSEGLANYNKVDAYISTVDKENLKTINLVQKNNDIYENIREEDYLYLKENYQNINIAKEYNLPMKIYFNKPINNYKKYSLYGISEATDVNEYGYKVIYGKSLINNYDEIIISEYFANLIIKGEYFSDINKIENIIYKKIKLDNNEYKVVGIIESSYLASYKNDDEKITNYGEIRDNLIYVKEGFYNNYLSKVDYVEYYLDSYLKDSDSAYDSNNTSISNIMFDDFDKIENYTINYYNRDKTSLLDNEILVSESYIENNHLCINTCNSDSFKNSEFVLSYDSKLLYASNDYKVVGTFSYDGSNDELDNLYTNGLILSSSLKEKIIKRIYTNYELLIGLSDNYKDNGRFINNAYDLGFSINKNFTSKYNEYTEIVTSISDTLNTISIVLLFVSIFLLYSFIQNSILISKRKIGILKSMGIDDLNVYCIFLIETLLVAISVSLASSLMILLTTPVINLFITKSYGFYFSALNIKPIVFIKICIVTIIISIMALIIPFIKFKKISTAKLIGSR